MKTGKIGHGMKSKKPTKKQMIKALEESGGIVRDAIAKLGMSKSDFYRHYRYNEDISKALEQYSNIGFENVTEVLYDLCLKGDTKAIALYLKYNPVAKSNNWMESQTMVIKAEKPLTDSEKEELKKELFGI